MTSMTRMVLGGEWLLVADGAPRVAIQLNSREPALVHVGQEAPGDDAACFSLLGIDRFFSASDLAAEDKVYARAANSGGAEITVLTGSSDA